MLYNFLKKVRDIYLVNIKYSKYKIGDRFHSGRNVVMWAKNNIEIGTDFYIGRNSIIECDAKIGNYVMFGNNVALIGRYDHFYQQVGVPTRLASQIRDKDYEWKGKNLKVVIEDDVWVGYSTILLSGVKVGKGSIIAAGSIVTRDVEPYSIYGGVPAKKISNRFNSDQELKEHIRKYKNNFL